MYNFSFRYHNLDYAYMAFDIKEDQVPAALDAIRLFSKAGSLFEGARNRKTGADECNGFKFLFIISGAGTLLPGNDLAQHCGDSYVLPICMSGGKNGI